MRLAIVGIALWAFTGCVSTDVTQLSRNQFVISTSAAPACGTSGARRVVNRMAAVETIRQGFDRFIVLDGRTESNVSSVYMPPTSAFTSGQATTYGNTTYGSATTTYSGGGVMYVGSNDSSLNVVMLRATDPGYDNAIDARQALGPDWERLVKEGIRTCG